MGASRSSRRDLRARRYAYFNISRGSLSCRALSREITSRVTRAKCGLTVIGATHRVAQRDAARRGAEWRGGGDGGGGGGGGGGVARIERAILCRPRRASENARAASLVLFAHQRRSRATFKSEASRRAMREGSAVAAEGELVFWVTDEARRGHSFIPRAFRGPTRTPCL